MSTSPALQFHGDPGDLRHVQAGGEQFLAPGEHLRGRSLHQHMGVFQHQNAIHVPGDLVHAVAHQNNGFSLVAVIVPDVGHEVFPARRVKARRGLVQHQHLRLHGQYARQRHPALLSAGQLKGGFFQLIVPDTH